MTRRRCASLLLVVLLAVSALAQNDTLVVDHGTAFEAAATGKTSMLAVFTARAKDVSCNCGEIDALRVGLDGHPIAGPFRVAFSFELQTQPAVAFDGERFLVAWNELPDPPLTGLPEPPHVVGAFVSEDGTTSAPFTIAESKEVRPVIVWDRTRYVVFCTDPDGNASGVQVTAQGAVGTPFGLGLEQEIVAAAAGDSKIALISRHGNHVFALFPGGPAQDLASGANDARVAWNGNTFLFVWTQDDGVYARTPGGEPHLVAADPSFPANLQLVASGSLFFAAWEGALVSTAWIDVEPFGVMANVGNGYLPLRTDPHDPIVTDVPGDAVALFYRRTFAIGQLGGFTNEYVSFAKPGRQRGARR